MTMKILIQISTSKFNFGANIIKKINILTPYKLYRFICEQMLFDKIQHFPANPSQLIDDHTYCINTPHSLYNI